MYKLFFLAEPVTPNQEISETKSRLNPCLQSRLSPAVARPTKTSVVPERPGFQRVPLDQDNQEVGNFYFPSKFIS